MEEEEEGDENAPVNTTNVTRGPHERSSSGQRTLRPPTPIHASAASSPPASSSVASPTIVSRTRKDPLASAELSLYGSATNSVSGRVKAVRSLLPV